MEARALQREALLRPDRSQGERGGERSRGRRAPRAPLPVPGGRAARGARSVPGAAGDRLGSGRAEQHGGLELPPAEADRALREYKAISEWPCGKQWADYALFYGNELIGIVEAKKSDKDVISDLVQAKEYAKLISNNHNIELLGKWNEYNVPFMFSTNGRNFKSQLEMFNGREKSL